MNDTITRPILRIVRILRAVAIAIGIIAVIDPSITTNRSVKPVVVVTAVDSARDASLAARVSQVLGRQFTVVRAGAAGASAIVVVGDQLPSREPDASIPAFAVAPDTSAARVAIDRIEVPRVIPSDARAPVVAHVSVHGASGRSLDVTLRAGAAIADRVTRRLANDSTLTIQLGFVPATVGAVAVRVSATLSGVTVPAIADAALDVRARRWAVLFYDPRPSWTSTFVRRAIERDPRFVVTSRTVTSRSVSTDAGRPPVTLGDAAALLPFDAVVVGAPEGLSAGDVDGLEAFMRRRGGSVLLLLDQRAPGAYDRLTSVSVWSSANTAPNALASAGHDSATLRAAEIAWPSALPAGAKTVAGGARPVVWESPVGAGSLVVSGALDAWRFRDPSTSGFDAFWRALIGERAAAAPPPLSVDVASSIVAPNELVDVHAVVRDAALQPVFTNAALSRNVRASVAATIEAVDPSRRAGARAIRLWPAPDVGQFRGTIRAPGTPGTYRVTVRSDGAAADAPLIVASDVRRPAPIAGDLLVAWAAAHGGRMFHASELEGLSAALRSAIRPPTHVETWHPMRSVWWIAPFVLALSAEWWLRRRRGLR